MSVELGDICKILATLMAIGWLLPYVNALMLNEGGTLDEGLIILILFLWGFSTVWIF